MGPEARRGALLGGHTRVSKNVNDGEVEAWWECSTQHDGRTKARTWKTPRGTEIKAEGICSEKATGEAGWEKNRPQETQGRQGEVSAKGAVNDVNGIEHFNVLLRPCTAKGCDVTGLQETKRERTSKIVASGYRVFFSCDCNKVKGRKGQHGVGLAIKEEIVKKAGENVITIECISAHLLKVRISIKPNFVTLVVAYAPTKEASGGQKAKYMAALNCTVASVPAREYVFVLTDANAKTEKRGEGGGEADGNVLGANARDILNENGKLLLGFAEDNKLALLNTSF